MASVNSLQSIQARQETRLIFLSTFFSTMLFCFPMNVFDLANFDFKEKKFAALWSKIKAIPPSTSPPPPALFPGSVIAFYSKGTEAINKDY